MNPSGFGRRQNISPLDRRGSFQANPSGWRAKEVTREAAVAESARRDREFAEVLEKKRRA
jgi:hypothetical protein